MGLRDEDTVKNLLADEEQSWETVRAWVGTVVNAARFGSALYAFREDIIQQVLVKVLLNLRADKYAGRSSLKTYVYEIAKNTCIDFMRDKYRRKHLDNLDDLNYELTDPGENPYGRLLGVERQQRLAEAMRQAPETCRQLWLMILTEKRSYLEIAGLWNTTEGAVKQSVYRCNRGLVELLNPQSVKSRKPQSG